MNKRLLILIIHLVISLSIFANDKGVLITHTDNSTTFLPLEKEIRVKFVDNETLKFSGAGISNLELNVSKVSNIRIAEKPTGLFSLNLQNTQISISETEIILSGLPDKQIINLYDVNGKLIKESTANSYGKVFFDTKNLTKGVYLLSVSNSKTYKIIKK